MALGTVNWATADVVSRTKSTRDLRDEDGRRYYIQEVIETIVLECVAVTYASANAELTNNDQPEDPGGGVKDSYSYSMQEQDRQTGAYSIQRTYESKRLEWAL
jgi:hypothetical protein